MRTFSCSDRFWHVELRDDAIVVTHGRIGTVGQTKRRECADAAEALREHDRLIAEKLRKGYAETTAKVVRTPLTASLESALVENPDDLAAHAAYADYLAEQGDPRGELIQVQLALEDASRSPAQRKKLRQREADLLALHGRQWLGETRRFLWGKWCGADRPWRYGYRRGWLDTLRVLPGPEEALEVLAQAPEVRLLRRLEVVYDMRYHPDLGDWAEGPAQALEVDEDLEAYEMVEDFPVLGPLLKSPHLGNLRALKLGFSDDDPDQLRYSTMIRPFSDCSAKRLLQFLGKYPRLEELYLNLSLADPRPLYASSGLGALRVLQHDFGTDREGGKRTAYPLKTLAGNPSLRHLHTLRLHPGRDTTLRREDLRAILTSANLPALTHLQLHAIEHGNAAAEDLVASGILRRLKVLDLAYGNMTDAGARLLAESPDLRNLETLDLSRNSVSAAGIDALWATGVRVIAHVQHDPDEQDYLWEVDAE